MPLGRLGTKRDLADLVLFLCSPPAAYISGTIIPVDGCSTNTAGGLRSLLKP